MELNIKYATNVDDHITRKNYWVGKQNRDCDWVVSFCFENAHRQPLLIYGKEGVGKSLMLHFVGNELKEHYTGRVLFVSADVLSEQYLRAGQNDIHVADFLKFYSDPDCLLFDDVDKMSDYETQQALLKILKRRADKNRPTILTSSKTMSNLKRVLPPELYLHISSSEIVFLPLPEENDRKGFIRWFLEKKNLILDEKFQGELFRMPFSFSELTGILNSLHCTSKSRIVNPDEVQGLIAFYTE